MERLAELQKEKEAIQAELKDANAAYEIAAKRCASLKDQLMGIELLMPRYISDKIEADLPSTPEVTAPHVPAKSTIRHILASAYSRVPENFFLSDFKIRVKECAPEGSIIEPGYLSNVMTKLVRWGTVKIIQPKTGRHGAMYKKLKPTLEM